MKITAFSLFLLSASVDSFSGLSSFTQSSSSSRKAFVSVPRNTLGSGMTMYDTSRDPPHNPELNSWAVLSTTEKWISETLEANNQMAASSTRGGPANPYARKEVSYVCESRVESPMIVAGIFKHLKENRELGQAHGEQQEEIRDELDDPEFVPKTLRQTQVIVIPGNTHLMDSFPTFDKLINNINQARRDARDYVTDAMLEKIDEDEEDRDWCVAINCAHLHPNYGEKTPEQVLQEMKEEEEAGEVDVHLENYKKARLAARRSPYPTVVMEVRATPPPDFSQSPPPSVAAGNSASQDSRDRVSAADIQKLEALFGKTAAETKSPSSEDFWNELGSTLQEVSSVTPLNMAQRWIANHDPDVHPNAAFTETDTPHVDAAYEFVFTNVAMMQEDFVQTQQERRYYLVMPHFLSSAATSFEKFAAQVDILLHCLPDLAAQIDITTFHPEHIDPDRRSPVPIFTMQLKKN